MLQAKRNETKYPELVAHLREQIQSGRWKAGDRLPTFVQLREELGIHTNTFSRALRDLEQEGLVVREPRRGVFVREQVPEARSAAREKTIALMLTDFKHQFFTEIVQSVEAACTAAGYRMVIANSNDRSEVEGEQILKLKDHVAGFIIAPVASEVRHGNYATLLDEKVPFVFIIRHLEALSVATVESENEQGGYLATRHLLDQGRTNIQVLHDCLDSASVDRIAGFKRAMREAGIGITDRNLWRTFNHGDGPGYLLAKEVLAEMKPKGREDFGVFALNTQLARGMYLACEEAGLKIPQDVAVVGFDDVEAAYFDPPLTTVRQELGGMGATAVEMLLEWIRTSGSPRGLVRLESTLIVRNSTNLNSEFSLKRHLLEGSFFQQASLAATV